MTGVSIGAGNRVDSLKRTSGITRTYSDILIRPNQLQQYLSTDRVQFTLERTRQRRRGCAIIPG
jgi:hypothetical protein